MTLADIGYPFLGPLIHLGTRLKLFVFSNTSTLALNIPDEDHSRNESCPKIDIMALSLRIVNFALMLFG